ncbi:MAG TPA: RNA polymerase sigma factor [Solirubrobacteraceae bacterium]|nr:RNA polymerase sigma factor [Solirubrobacteraceae bacterium]
MARSTDRSRWSDEQLLAAIAGCDDRASSAFYRRHLRPVLAWLMRRTGDPELAADLTAEVFAAAMIAAPRYEPRHPSAEAWLTGIARNVLGHSVRRGRVDARARRQLGVGTLPIDDNDIERVHEMIDAHRTDVAGHLSRLPADERAAVRARIIDERDYRDIARSLGCSELVIRKRVSRGLARLRAELAG